LIKNRLCTYLPYSVSSLLTARESDPEDVLKGLGFRGPSVLDKIPDRFIHTGTICDGVDSEQFLCTVQEGDCEDAMLMVSPCQCSHNT
jgi:hypothetical protein